MNKFKYIKALWSPFKPFKLKWYFGKTQLGVPYFLPRKWVKATPERATKAALDKIEEIKAYNERNAKNGSTREIKPFEEYYKEYLRYDFAVPKKIGFDVVGLGYKIKWTDTDYRFEWAPRISFVFFGLQLAVTVVAPARDHYWEAWLYYEKDTDKTKSKEERIQQCMKGFPLNYKVSETGSDGWKLVNYYEQILRKKYLKYINNEQTKTN